MHCEHLRDVRSHAVSEQHYGHIRKLLPREDLHRLDVGHDLAPAVGVGEMARLVTVTAVAAMVV